MQTTSTFDVQLLEELPRLRGSAMMLTRSKAAADDLLQETAYFALRSQLQFTVGTNLRAWLYRIMRNAFISSVRRTKHTIMIEDLPDNTFSQDGNQENVVMTNEVADAMIQLRPRQRAILLMVCAYGLSYEEAAKAQNCSVGTAKSRIWRARGQLKRLLENRHVSVAANSEGNSNAEEVPELAQHQSE